MQTAPEASKLLPQIPSNQSKKSKKKRSLPAKGVIPTAKPSIAVTSDTLKESPVLSTPLVPTIPDPNISHWYSDEDIDTFVNASVTKRLGGLRDSNHHYLLKNKTQPYRLPDDREISAGCHIAITAPIDLVGINYIVRFLPSDMQGISSIDIAYHLDKSVRPVDTQAEILQRILSIPETNWTLEVVQKSIRDLESPEGRLEIIQNIINSYQHDVMAIRQQLQLLLTKLARAETVVFDELMPRLQQEQEGYAIILFAYNITQQHWLTGEIILHKNKTHYTARIYAHDPCGGGRMSTENFKLLQTAIIKRVKNEDPQAQITSEDISNCVSPYNRRQAEKDGTSCGVIVAADLIKRIEGRTLLRQKPYKPYAKKLRKRQLQFIANCSEISEKTRAAFIKRMTQKDQQSTLELLRKPRVSLAINQDAIVEKIVRIINDFQQNELKVNIVSALSNKKILQEDVTSYRVGIESALSELPIILANQGIVLGEKDATLINELYYIFIIEVGSEPNILQELANKYATQLILRKMEDEPVADKQSPEKLDISGSKDKDRIIDKDKSPLELINKSSPTPQVVRSRHTPEMSAPPIFPSPRSPELRQRGGSHGTAGISPEKKHISAPAARKTKYDLVKNAITNIHNIKDFLLMGLAVVINILLTAKNPIATLVISSMSSGLTLWNEYQIAARQNHRLKHYESKLKRRLNGWAANKTLTVFEFMFYTSLLISVVALVYYIGISIGGILTTGSEQEAFIKQGLILINMAAILPVLARKLHVAGAKYYADIAQDEYEKAAQVDVENLQAKDDLVHDLDGRLEQLENENTLLMSENKEANMNLEEIRTRAEIWQNKYNKQQDEYEQKIYVLESQLSEMEQQLNEIKSLKAIISPISPAQAVSELIIAPANIAPKAVLYRPGVKLPDQDEPAVQKSSEITPTPSGGITKN